MSLTLVGTRLSPGGPGGGLEATRRDIGSHLWDRLSPGPLELEVIPLTLVRKRNLLVETGDLSLPPEDTRSETQLYDRYYFDGKGRTSHQNADADTKKYFLVQARLPLLILWTLAPISLTNLLGFVLSTILLHYPVAELMAMCVEWEDEETYWTQGAFDAVVGRLQLTGTACDLDISTAGFLDAFVENLADLFKELSHTQEEFQHIDRKLSRFYPDQTSKEHAVRSGELYGYCKSREVCEAVTRGHCGDWQKCSLCLAWPVRANSSDMDCVPASSVPFYHFLIEGAKYMHRAWTMVQFSRSKPQSGRNVWQDDMAATTEYMAACTAAYADQFQADWRGTGQQVPLDVLRAALVCWPQRAQEIPALADHMQVLGAYWILYMLSDSLGSEAPSWVPDRPIVLEHMPSMQNPFRQG
ncbi:atg4 [Symbiodinium sp. CCMP2592]|nr:atg4 [Symbiodinium sp. CCMP2592]